MTQKIMWHKLNLHKSNIVTTTEKAVLIQLPKLVSDRLRISEGHVFWMPLKLLREVIGNDQAFTVSMTDDFDVTLRKFDDQRQLVSEYKFKGAILIEAWNG